MVACASRALITYLDNVRILQMDHQVNFVLEAGKQLALNFPIEKLDGHATPKVLPLVNGTKATPS